MQVSTRFRFNCRLQNSRFITALCSARSASLIPKIALGVNIISKGRPSTNYGVNSHARSARASHAHSLTHRFHPRRRPFVRRVLTLLTKNTVVFQSILLELFSNVSKQSNQNRLPTVVCNSFIQERFFRVQWLTAILLFVLCSFSKISSFLQTVYFIISFSDRNDLVITPGLNW